jgi:ankyrin repeat protein
MFATALGRVDAMRMLLDHSADPNARALDGKTALMLAVVSRESEAVRLLLHYGADKNVRDRNGVSPRELAETIGFREGTALLDAN